MLLENQYEYDKMIYTCNHYGDGHVYEKIVDNFKIIYIVDNIYWILITL